MKLGTGLLIIIGVALLNLGLAIGFIYIAALIIKSVFMG